MEVLDRSLAYLGLSAAPIHSVRGTMERATSLSPRAFLAASADPRDLPLAMTLAVIPTAYILGHVSGNVSWIDRIWTTFPLCTTAAIIGWTYLHADGEGYAASLPRLALLFCLQLVWSIRLTRHTARRGLYHLNSEDYRYVVMRKLIPAFAFEFIHVFLVVIAQPMLLFALSLPVAALVQPAAALTAGPYPKYSLGYGAFLPFLPGHLSHVDPATPVLHVFDAFIALLVLTAIAVEGMGDNAMYAFQTAKHALMDKVKQMQKQQASSTESSSRAPAPVQVPPAYYPGFPIRGLHAWSRHPNFVSEQAFWLSQAFFTINCTRTPDLEVALGPAFAISILFCASTALTEWITTRKYPVYKDYSRLVGQFIPQETALKWLWTTLRGSRPRVEAEVYARGAELYRIAVAEGSLLAPPDDDLSASNICVADRADIQGIRRAGK